MPKNAAKVIRPRFRILYGEEIALGPGKIELLERIVETGSIADAARQLEMSYMRAWSLIKTMEHCFKKPLVQSTRGGSEHGGARLTETGLEIVQLYREMEKKSFEATKTLRAKLEGYLK